MCGVAVADSAGGVSMRLPLPETAAAHVVVTKQDACTKYHRDEREIVQGDLV